ncbi:MAG: protein BatD, partial [Bacteroidaceae bacterium]|nr:protein BatD [Bacteroidaceae bacterium]
VIVWRKKAIENANIAKVKTKKANKVASKRLKQAKKLMSGGEEAAFYDEVLKALWGYTSDKLGIPVAQLSKDNIATELALCNVPENTISEFTTLLSDCEFARYAPAISGIKVQDIYDRTVSLMDKLENNIKIVKN